ncbi:DUF2218 domain-containing protein [Nocardioides sp. TRM66260-LWL]|uniref:DUF2218 domain-containing protein n=1 Tax=Nocardioides sp. TRM66260-LWL TaxID=2874478 RepID=UPI001CC69378|nr:DUF2218 domain-containing protein [Nocardioides sp. TRM66260-LWL]MBZ5736400.1 DUF2218 domain-containing protein [Nocardioides sp. TRM66260-LWL]
MLHSTARIDTPRAERYRDQLARHGAGMLRQTQIGGAVGLPPIRDASTVEGAVVLEFAWGRCTVTATQGELVLFAEASTAADLERIQSGVGGRVTRIGRRDGLSVAWSAAEGEQSPESVLGSSPRHGRLFGGIAFVVILAAVVVVHLGLAAALVGNGWTWWALLALGLVVTGKVLAVRHFAARHLVASLRGHLPPWRRH